MKQLNVIDLFSGVGGLSHGFYYNNNFKVIAANELLHHMAVAYSLNHPDVLIYEKDISNFNSNDVYKDTNLQSGDIDIVIGGPPCQAYSTVGKRLLEDPRGKLFQQYYRLLKEFKPKFFLFENVTGLLSMGDDLHSKIMTLFTSLNYKVESPVLNAVDYGVPETRKRVIITGTLLGRSFNYPDPTHFKSESLFTKNKYLTLKDAISDLPFIKSGTESNEYFSPPQNLYQKLMRINAPEKLNDHNSSNHNQNLIALMDELPDGGSPRDVHESLRPKSGFGNTYCRLWWEKPSPTITRNLGTPSSSRCIHPKVPRALTTREGARIQSFPDDFQFYGSRSARNLQIGNAVPPLLSKVLAEAILNHFTSY